MGNKIKLSFKKNFLILCHNNKTNTELKLIIKTDNSIVMKATTTLVPTFIDNQKITTKLYKKPHIKEKISNFLNCFSVFKTCKNGIKPNQEKKPQ